MRTWRRQWCAPGRRNGSLSEGWYRGFASTGNNRVLRPPSARHDGWKKRTLAGFARVSLSTIERIERGEAVSPESLDRVAEALRQPPGAFTAPRIPSTSEEAWRRLEESAAPFAETIAVAVKPLRGHRQIAELARAHLVMVDGSRLWATYMPQNSPRCANGWTSPPLSWPPRTRSCRSNRRRPSEAPEALRRRAGVCPGDRAPGPCGRARRYLPDRHRKCGDANGNRGAGRILSES